jgi:hypothetical protein
MVGVSSSIHLAVVDLVDAADPDAVAVGPVAPEAFAVIIVAKRHGAVGGGHAGQLVLLVKRQRLAAARGHVAAGVIGVGRAVGAGHRVRLGTVTVGAGTEILVRQEVADGVVRIGLAAARYGWRVEFNFMLTTTSNKHLQSLLSDENNCDDFEMIRATIFFDAIMA